MDGPHIHKVAGHLVRKSERTAILSPLDKLGLDVIHIQAKKWQKGNNVSRKELQSFVGALAGQSGKKGVFITTSDFTKEALDYNPSNVKIAKINGHRLAQLMIQYNVGVTANVIYELKKIDSDYFEE